VDSDEEAALFDMVERQIGRRPPLVEEPPRRRPQRGGDDDNLQRADDGGGGRAPNDEDVRTTTSSAGAVTADAAMAERPMEFSRRESPPGAKKWDNLRRTDYGVDEQNDDEVVCVTAAAGVVATGTTADGVAVAAAASGAAVPAEHRPESSGDDNIEGTDLLAESSSTRESTAAAETGVPSHADIACTSKEKTVTISSSSSTTPVMVDLTEGVVDSTLPHPPSLSSSSSSDSSVMSLGDDEFGLSSSWKPPAKRKIIDYEWDESSQPSAKKRLIPSDPMPRSSFETAAAPSAAAADNPFEPSLAPINGTSASSNVKSIAAIPTKMPIRVATVILAKSAKVAPTSLSRLWPDPSDVIKALTRWTPPTARERPPNKNAARGGVRTTVDFYGPQCRTYLLSESDRNNPLLRSPHTAAAVGAGRGNAARGSRRGREQAPPATAAAPPPIEFKNSADIMNTMFHPLMTEGLCSINSDYNTGKFSNGKWRSDSYYLRLMKLTEVSPIFQSKSYFCDGTKMYEAQLSAHGKKGLPPSTLSELYCLHFHGWKTCKFGIVGYDFPTTTSFRQYNPNSEGGALKLWLVVHPNESGLEQTGWLSGNDFKKIVNPNKNGIAAKQNTFFTLMSCGSTTNIVRQFEAIKCLPHLKPHIRRALYTSTITDSPKVEPVSKPRSLPIDIWRSLSTSHNSYQSQAISQLLSGSCRENVCLIQGPPGTGKSSTIVGLVTALMSGKAPLPRQRQSGTLIHAGKTMGAKVPEPHARNRILVCAATNQAVDHLCWKIKQEAIGASGKVSDFALGRFGSLPWEVGRDSNAIKKLEAMTELESFLYKINVDTKASDDQTTTHADDEASANNRKKRKRVVGSAKLRQDILSGCNVVVTTLSGAGSKGFIDAVCRDHTKNDSEFDAVIIDEACQASEPESLIPFKYNPTTITLVGDPQQLPVLTLSNSSGSKLLERSLFERLYSLNYPTILLRSQYRMHEKIAAFPSQLFYNGMLTTPDVIKERAAPPWDCPCLPTMCFWDTCGRNMTSSNNHRGFSNKVEANFITGTLLSTFARTFLKRSKSVITIGVISFYRDQVNLLRDQLAQIPALSHSNLRIKVDTVDGFQGSECDIIILSCVRSHSHSNSMRGGQRRDNTIGFLSDHRRVNVALTRAKHSLWIVGDTDVLQVSDLWRRLIQHMAYYRTVRRTEDFVNLYAAWRVKFKVDTF